MKKTSLLFAAGSPGLGLLDLSGYGNNSSVATVADADVNEIVTLRSAYVSNSQPVTDAMNEFGCLVGEKTDGSIQIQHFSDRQLGGEREPIELTQSGAVNLTKVNASTLESFFKDCPIFSIPHLFNDREHFFKMMDNEEIMEPIYQSTKNLGLTGLTHYDSGQRSFYMVDGSTHMSGDLEGKKIHVMQSEIAIKTVEFLDGSPIPIGSGEVYTSLQSNLINGSESNESVSYTAGHNGVARYYSYDEHIRMPDIITMNDAIREQPTDEQEKAIEEVAKESTAFEIEAFVKTTEEEKALAQEEYGVQFNDVGNTLFREAAAPLHDIFKDDPVYKGFYQKIQK